MKIIYFNKHTIITGDNRYKYLSNYNQEINSVEIEDSSYDAMIYIPFERNIISYFYTSYHLCKNVLAYSNLGRFMDKFNDTKYNDIEMNLNLPFGNFSLKINPITHQWVIFKDNVFFCQLHEADNVMQSFLPVFTTVEYAKSMVKGFESSQSSRLDRTNKEIRIGEIKYEIDKMLKKSRFTDSDSDKMSKLNQESYNIERYLDKNEKVYDKSIVLVEDIESNVSIKHHEKICDWLFKSADLVIGTTNSQAIIDYCKNKGFDIIESESY